VTVSPALTKLLAALPEADRVDFAALDAAMEALRYTGPIVVHYLNGRKRQVDLGAPVRLSIIEGGVDTGADPVKR
jgi:hypothetical protein